MRFIYEADRLINMVHYYNDTLKDIHEEESAKLEESDHREVFNKVGEMLNSLELRASEEYEYALRNTSKPFWKKTESVVPRPAISIDSIVDYVTEKGYRVSTCFPYTMANHKISYYFSSHYSVVVNRDIDLPEMDYDHLNHEVKSFLVFKPEGIENNAELALSLRHRLLRYFSKLLEEDQIKPSQYELSPDDQGTLNYIAKSIRKIKDERSEEE